MVYAPFPAGATPTADDLNNKIVQETMAWTNLASVGAYASGFAAATPPPRMHKLVVAGTEIWEFEGKVTAPSVAAGTTVTALTFNVGNRVGSQRLVMSGGITIGGYAVFVVFNSSGTLQVLAPSGSGTLTAFWLDNVRITNPLA